MEGNPPTPSHTHTHARRGVAAESLCCRRGTATEEHYSSGLGGFDDVTLIHTSAGVWNLS